MIMAKCVLDDTGKSGNSAEYLTVNNCLILSGHYNECDNNDESITVMKMMVTAAVCILLS